MNLVRRVAQATWDLLAWVAAIPIAAFLRFDGAIPEGVIGKSLAIGAILGVIQVALSYGYQVIKGRYVVASFDEISAITLTASLTALIGLISVSLTNPPVLPRTVPVIAMAFALGLMLAGRFALRFYRQRIATPKHGERVLIYGAGESGEQIVRQMLATSESGFIPIGFIDDDPSKLKLRIQGTRVLGDRSALEAILKKTRPDIMVVAIGAIQAAQLMDLDRRCAVHDVVLRVIPTTSEIIGGAVKLGDISDVREEDLLGRRPITTDESAIREFLVGRKVLITGAGGSIGSELARQIHRYEPAYVGLLDRDESALHALQLSLDGRGLLDSENLILADIRDASRMQEVMAQVHPDIVFHAAALKHLPLLERYPIEAHKTNVIGTSNVLTAAQSSGTPIFINISTDKAADPTSVLGRTKLQTERMVADSASGAYEGPADGCRYLSVRFGNVIGSRGSVLSTFRHQIAHGGPVTVTDPDVTRYFMTVSEAVHLVLQAAVLGENGDTLVLDMGEPVAIADVAARLVERSGRDIPIIYTGLRPGEKMTEVLFGNDEIQETPPHPLIWRIRPHAGVHQSTH